MNRTVKIPFTAEAISQGGRSGTLHPPDGLLEVTLGNPLVKGVAKRGPNAEWLFAGAFSAFYHGALRNAAKTLGIPVADSTAPCGHWSVWSRTTKAANVWRWISRLNPSAGGENTFAIRPAAKMHPF